VDVDGHGLARQRPELLPGPGRRLVDRAADHEGPLVEDGPPLGGYAAEVVATAVEATQVRALRVTMPDLPLPASMELEDGMLTSVEQIVVAACDALDAGPTHVLNS
jgi:hypothetical protein